MTSQELCQIAHRGLAIGPSPLLRHTGGRHALVEGVALVAWGPPTPAFRKAAVVGPAPPLGRVLELAGAFFGCAADGFGVLVEADAGHPVEAELRAAGWQVAEDEPALVLPQLPPAPPLPEGLVVRRVRDAEARRDLVQVLAAGFGAPTAEADFGVPAGEDFDAFAPSLACALDPDAALFVGYAEGRPVSSSVFYRVAEIACITGVATVPAYRRRGYARALTFAALAEGSAHGCTCATLGGLGASYEMYRRMGFVHACNHRLYMAPRAP
jgi:GNAT superfamily N-acetyltransferase